MGYRLDSQSLKPSTGNIFPFSMVSRLALGPTQPPIQRILGTVSPGVKCWHEADNSPSSSAKVKNVGAPLPRVYSQYNA
jgi:hypothetical protein